MMSLSRRVARAFFVLLFTQTLLVVGNANETKPESLHSGEEAIIRMVYKKLMLYNRAAVSALRAEARLKPRRDPSESLQFEIRDLHTGPIEEIHKSSFGELVTQPTGSVIQLERETYEAGAGPEHVMYHARWANGHTPIEDWKSITVGEMLSRDHVRMGDVGKYTSYEVALRFQGKERTYRAIAFFHEPFQSVSEPNPELIDAIVGPDHVNNLIREDRMPVITRWDKYIKSSLHNSYTRAVQQGVRETGTNFAANCPSGYEFQGDPVWGGWCCNDSSMQCCLPNPEAGEASCCSLLNSLDVEGGKSADDKASLPELYAAGCAGEWDGGDGDGGGGGGGCIDRRIDFPPASDHSERYDNDHIFGDHWANAAFQGYCLYTSACVVRCRVDWYSELSPSHATFEDGVTILYEHAVATDTKNRTEDGTLRFPGQPGEIICGRAYSVAWKYCLLPFCSGSIKISWAGQGFESTTTEWNKWDHFHTQRCSLAPR
jgi:hypothetical protein